MPCRNVTGDFRLQGMKLYVKGRVEVGGSNADTRQGFKSAGC